MILRYNFFLQNNRLCFGIQIPLSRVYARFNSFDISGAFTFCAWSNTGTVQSYSIPEKCDDIRFLSVFIDWYTFQLQEVRKRFFCFRKKSSPAGPAKTTYYDLTVVPERFRYLGILCNGIPTYLIWIPTPIDLIVGSYT